MYSWHYDGAISDYTGNYSKNIFLGETRILTKVNRADTFTSEEYAKQYWYHSDHLGSASLITDYQGKEYERIEYTPYGELWVERKTPTDNLDTIFRFSGKELDVETGNYYYGSRYLDPRTSRWLSTDPALGDYIPGAPVNDEARKRNGNLPGMGGVFNVVNFHLYHYAGNNPVKYVDPTGREDTENNIIPNINNVITTTDAVASVVGAKAAANGGVPALILSKSENGATTVVKVLADPDLAQTVAATKVIGKVTMGAGIVIGVADGVQTGVKNDNPYRGAFRAVSNTISQGLGIGTGFLVTAGLTSATVGVGVAPATMLGVVSGTAVSLGASSGFAKLENLLFGPSK